MPTPQRVTRDNLLLEIETLLETNKTIRIHGPRGSGRAELLRQFARTHDTSSIHLELSADSPWALNSEIILADYSAQLWARASSEPPPKTDKHSFSRVYDRLTRIARASSSLYHILVYADDEFPSQHPDLLHQLESIFPYGLGAFRIVSTLPPPNRVSFREYTVTCLTQREARQLLAQYGLSDEDTSALWRLAKGLPGPLIRAAELYHSGTPIASLAAAQASLNLHSSAHWTVIESGSITERLAQLVTFSRTPLTVELAAQLVDSDLDAVESVLESSPLFSRNSDGQVTFSDRGLLTEARERFQNSRAATAGHLAGAALSQKFNPNVDDLTSYLAQAGETELVLQAVTPSTLRAAAEQSESLQTLLRITDRAIDAAASTRNLEALAPLAVARASFSSLRESEADLRRLELAVAREALSDAEPLIERARYPEERLRLLALYLSERQRMGLELPTHHREQVTSLVDRVDLDLLAQDLEVLLPTVLGASPEAAQRLISRYREEAHQPLDSNQLDWQVAVATVRNSRNNREWLSLEHGPAAELRESIANPDARSFVLLARGLLGSRTAEETLAHAASIQEPRRRIGFQQQWLQISWRSASAVELALQTFDLAVAESEFAVTAAFLCDLSRPLLASPRTESSDLLSRRLHAHRGQAELTGPTVAALQFRSHLAAYVAKSHPDAGYEQVLDILDAAIQLSNPTDRLIALAELLASVREADADGYLAATYGVVTDLEKELTAASTGFVGETALVAEAIRPVLRALLRSSPGMLERVLASTMPRRHRDNAALWIVEHAARHLFPPAALPALSALLCATAPGAPKDLTRRRLVSSLTSPTFTKLTPDEIESIETIRQDSDQEGDPISSAYATAALIRAGAEPAAHGCTLICENLHKADGLGDQVDCAVEIASSVGNQDGIADKMVAIVEAVAAQRRGVGRVRSGAHWHQVCLAVQTLVPLCADPAYSDRGQTIARRIIDSADSDRHRIIAASALAVGAHYRGAQSVARDLTQGLIWPLWQRLESDDRAALRICGPDAIAAIDTYSSEIARELVRKAEGRFREDLAFSVGLSCLAKKYALSWADLEALRLEPVSYADTLKVRECIEHLEHGGRVLSLVRLMCRSVREAPKNPLTANQRIELERALREMAQSRFPIPGGIAHEGYAVLVEAEALTLLTGGAARSQERWRSLLDRAMKLPVAADAGLVAAGIYDLCPSHIAPEAAGAARSKIAECQSVFDRVVRLETLATLLTRKKSREAKEIWAEALRTAVGLGGSDGAETRRSLVDTLYRTDPERAEEVLQRLDDDEARKFARQARHAERVSTHHKSLRSSSVTDDVPREAITAFAAACQSAREQAGCVPTQMNRDTLLRLLVIASRHPIQVIAPVLQYAIDGLAHSIATESQMARWFAFASQLADFAMFTRASMNEDYVASSPSQAAGDMFFVDDQGGASVREVIEDQLAGTACESMWVVDAYFRLEDLRMLLPLAGRPVDVKVLAGPAFLADARKTGNGQPTEGLRETWRGLVGAAANGPRLEVVIACAGHSTPVHDRWVLTESDGLSLGTSASGFGQRLSACRRLTLSEVGAVREQVLPFITRMTRVFGGKVIDYTVLVA